MKRSLSLLFLIGVMAGLFGGELVYVRSMFAAAPARTMAMGPDCAAMMANQQQAPAEKQCKEHPPGCIIAPGCVAPWLAADLANSLVAARHIEGRPIFRSAATVLAGRDFAPDPDPPMHLG